MKVYPCRCNAGLGLPGLPEYHWYSCTQIIWETTHGGKREETGDRFPIAHGTASEFFFKLFQFHMNMKSAVRVYIYSFSSFITNLHSTQNQVAFYLRWIFEHLIAVFILSSLGSWKFALKSHFQCASCSGFSSPSFLSIFSANQCDNLRPVAEAPCTYSDLSIYKSFKYTQMDPTRWR